MKCECDECRGRGYVPCPDCDGEGQIEISFTKHLISEWDDRWPSIQELKFAAKDLDRQLNGLIELFPHKRKEFESQARELLAGLESEAALILKSA